MAAHKSTSGSPKSGVPLDQPISPFGGNFNSRPFTSNTVTDIDHGNGASLNNLTTRSSTTGSSTSGYTSSPVTISTSGAAQENTSDFLPGNSFPGCSLASTYTNAPAGGHNRVVSDSHIMDQNTQTMIYNGLPGALVPLRAQQSFNIVHSVAQLTLSGDDSQLAEDTSNHHFAPVVQESAHDSGSSGSSIRDASVIYEDSETGAPIITSPVTGYANATDSLTIKAKPEATAATGATSKDKGKGKAPQGIYTSSPSSSSTRFSAGHTSNHHLEATIEFKAGLATGSSKPSCSKGGWVPPHLRGPAAGGQLQRPVREPMTPGSSAEVVPLNNFNRGTNAFNNSLKGNELAPRLAAQLRQPGSAQSFNTTFSTFQSNGLVPRDRTSLQAPIGTGRLSFGGQSTRQPANATFGPAQSAGGPANMAGAVAGEGPVTFTPAGVFRPMNAVTQPFRHPDFDNQRELKAQLGISLNYAGDATIERNRSAPIPDSLNVAFFIRNLPPNVTYNQLLGQIRGMGRVWACVISPPNSEHVTSAAKVVFFELAAAQRFYAHCNNPARRLIVGGYVARVGLNRVKKAEENVGGNQSRVVVIMGRPSFVNPCTLVDWFDDHFKYQIDEIITHALNDEMGHVEVRFSSWRSQAEACRQAIWKVYPPGGATSPVWVFRYGLDPCSA